VSLISLAGEGAAAAFELTAPSRPVVIGLVDKAVVVGVLGAPVLPPAKPTSQPHRTAPTGCENSQGGIRSKGQWNGMKDGEGG